MPGRPVPPMYGAVQKKRVVQQHTVTINPKSEEQRQKEAAAAEKEAEKARKEADKARKEALKAAAPPKKAAKKKAAKKKTAKKATKKEAKGEAPKKPAKKAAKKAAKKFPKWSEDDTRDKLYRLAKKLDLDVNSRDPKDWIVSQLKKAEKKAK